jgi:hypothetical protein
MKRMGKTCDIDPHLLEVEITNNNRNKLRLFNGKKVPTWSLLI